MWSFPARFLVEFFDNHGMLGFRDRPQWRTVAGGSHRYVEALTAPWRDRLRLSTPVEAIARHDDHVTVTPRGAEAERFDHVVLATHSDQALRCSPTRRPREHELLGAIPYQPNEAVLHTDARLLPRRRRAWASWNYHLLEEPTGKPTVTYHMNRLQSLDAEREFCVTLNRTEAIDPDTVIRTIPYAHPVYTADGQAAQARHAEISGDEPHALLRRLLGLGLPRGRRGERRCASRERLGAASAVTPQRDLRGHDPPPPLRGARARVPPPDRDGLRRPRRAARRCSAAGSSAPRPGLVRFRRRDYLGDPAHAARRRPSARSSRARRQRARRARSACSPTCARSGTASTR